MKNHTPLTEEARLALAQKKMKMRIRYKDNWGARWLYRTGALHIRVKKENNRYYMCERIRWWHPLSLLAILVAIIVLFLIGLCRGLYEEFRPLGNPFKEQRSTII